jgi:3-keto-L-gulonate-6-phosphate decarboxylase
MEFMGNRQIDVVQVVNAKVGVDLVPTLRAAYPRSRVVVDVGADDATGQVWLTYVTSRYGNVIDVYCASGPDDPARLEAALVSPSHIRLLAADLERHDEAAAAAHEDVYGRLIAAQVTRAVGTAR